MATLGQSAAPQELASLPQRGSREEKDVRGALQDLAPELEIETIARISPAGIQTLWSISIANACQPLVLCGPPEVRGKKALRSEDHAIAVEIAAVEWLASLPPAGVQLGNDGKQIVHGGGREPGRSIVNYTGDSVNVCYVSTFMPELFRFFPKSAMNETLALWRPTPGATVAQFKRALADTERDSVDFEKGQLFRRLACHVSPTGNFGPVGHILRPRSRVPGIQALGLLLNTGDEPPTDIGRQSWASCFKGYLEGAWSDLGDFYINLNFDAFRGHFERFRHLLDRVKTPRLIALGGVDDTNAMIEETEDHGIKVTGIRDWSNFCFGDPLMAYVYQDGASPAFQRGTDTRFSDFDPLQHDPLIEDPANAPVRLALYKAYHAACGVARMYHQVRCKETDFEMFWRRKFMEALETLDNFENVDSNETTHPHRGRSGGRL